MNPKSRLGGNGSSKQEAPEKEKEGEEEEEGVVGNVCSGKAKCFLET